MREIQIDDLSRLLHARHPVVYFAAKIGDSVLALPTMRALGEMFDAPLTLICPEFAFSLCFREVSPLHVDTTGCFADDLPPILGAVPTIDCETLASRVGAADVLINTVSFNMPSDPVRTIRQRLAPTVIGFRNDYEEYDVVVPKQACHAADLMFEFARLFDPSMRIEAYAQPVAVDATVAEKARSMRAALAPGRKVLVVHTDTDWAAKRWSITKFIDVLDGFLSRHGEFVAWVVGMGHEDLDVGRNRDRVISHLGLPLDLTMSLIANAELFLGIDSCMLHAADLARVPGVGLFGPTRADTWGFRFAPHRHLDRRTTADITVDEVLGALDDLAEQHVYQDGPASRSRSTIAADLLCAVHTFDDTAKSWHARGSAPPCTPGDIATQALRLHALNFDLWHHEDAVRRPAAGDDEVARGKRRIDELNAQRNAAIEDIDAALLHHFQQRRNTELHTETPGMITDRLSVLTLRILHTAGAENRVAVLTTQYDELLCGLEQFLLRLQAGEIHFKQYRQFKSAGELINCALLDTDDGIAQK